VNSLQTLTTLMRSDSYVSIRNWYGISVTCESGKHPMPEGGHTSQCPVGGYPLLDRIILYEQQIEVLTGKRSEGLYH
jgi:hypothetical protein